MLVKDQLMVRMDQLGMTVNELAKRVGVSSQSVRHWLGGRSFPGKSKCNLIEEALSFKLDFSEGESLQSITVEQTIQQTSVNTLMAISRLQAEHQLIIAKVANAFSDLQQQLDAALAGRVTLVPKASPTTAPAHTPPKPANHGRVVSRVTRKPLVTTK